MSWQYELAGGQGIRTLITGTRNLCPAIRRSPKGRPPEESSAHAQERGSRKISHPALKCQDTLDSRRFQIRFALPTGWHIRQSPR